MHELDPSYTGLAPDADIQQRSDVMRWRKAERERLRAARSALGPQLRHLYGDRIAAKLDPLLGDVSSKSISFYWPINGEPDLRELMKSIVSRGGICALPVVVQSQSPLVFRAWKPGVKMRRGAWNIPEPIGGKEVNPDIIIAPVVGYDPGCFRLGYGGGYFDRTLANLVREDILTIGVGFSQASLITIYPQAHDIPLNRIVTEKSVVDPH